MQDGSGIDIPRAAREHVPRSAPCSFSTPIRPFMKVLDYVRNLLKRRLDHDECLVVYDPAERYRPAVEAMEEVPTCTVIYAEEGTIDGRDRAMKVWREMGAESPGAQQLLIYLPIDKPIDAEAKVHDPYAPFFVGGGLFPSGDAESYLEICVQAKPNHQEQVRSLFEEAAEPDLATVEAVGGGASWPRLRTVLDVESDREIVRSLLSPTKAQERRLHKEATWPSEYAAFTKQVLGLDPEAAEERVDAMRQELARFVLFSEFVFDLPEGEVLPQSLADVPRAKGTMEKLIRAVCEDLRTSKRHEETYKELARTVVDDLDLESQTEDIEDYGVLDTFPFEERAFLDAFVTAIRNDRREEARAIISDRNSSIWAYSEDRGSDWVLAERLLTLLETIDEKAAALESTGNSLSDLVEYYVSGGYEVDTAHRTLEQAVQEKYWQTGLLEGAVSDVRKQYRAFADQVQRTFMDRVEDEGWPPKNLLRQTHVFDGSIAPSLAEHGRRVAYVMVDAFRYELASAFGDRLSNEVEVTINAVASMMPTTTRVGMASLLPGAEDGLHLGIKDRKLIPRIDGKDIKGPDDRLAHLQKTYGDRCAMADLDDVLKGEVSVEETTQLLLVKTREIDTAGESMSDGIERLIDTAQEKYLQAVSALGDIGFEEVHFVTDHGFLLLSKQQKGDRVEKPSGDWLVQKERSLLGTGSKSKHTCLFRTDDLGVAGDFDHISVPRSLGAYRMGSKYMHSGLSLQESVLSVLSVETGARKKEDGKSVDLHLTYRGKRDGWVTTRRPMIEIEAGKTNIFGDDQLEFRLEARSDGKVVGHAASSNNVDPSTSLVQIDLGGSQQPSVKVPLSMKEDFRGAFEVVAVNPITQIRFDSITLKTDYVE